MAEKQIMVKIDHVSKEYRLGAIGGTTLREDLERFHAKIRKKDFIFFGSKDMSSKLVKAQKRQKPARVSPKIVLVMF